jgi:hypothetical protein
MAKRHGALGKNVTKKMSHPHKTKKRLATKRAMLAARKAR